MTLHDFFETCYRPLKLRNRSQNTIRLYRYSVRKFGQFLGRPATLEDLTDDVVSAHLAWLVEQRLSPYSVNKERSQLLAIWNFAARKRYVEQFPDVEAEVTPKRTPRAWMPEELRLLVGSCKQEKGRIGDCRARDWWLALVRVMWDTGERIGAVRQLEWRDLSGEWLLVRAETRKGRRADKQFRLHADTLEALEKIRAERELIFEWPYSETYIYYKYTLILKRAGLPSDSQSKFHRIRRSVASHYEAAGGNATEVLGHTSREVTKRYLDPRIVGVPSPSELLFRLEEGC